MTSIHVLLSTRNPAVDITWNTWSQSTPQLLFFSRFILVSGLSFRLPLDQRFSNFFQVGTTFISQNVLRTTLLLGLSNSLGLP